MIVIKKDDHHEHDDFDLQSLKKIADSGREENPDDIFVHLNILQNIFATQFFKMILSYQ